MSNLNFEAEPFEFAFDEFLPEEFELEWFNAKPSARKGVAAAWEKVKPKVEATKAVARGKRPLAKRPPKNIDAAVDWGNGKFYFFQCDKYIRWDIQKGYEYWAPIAKEWPGLFTENIDAAVNWGNGKVYFFKGDQYIRWDIQKGYEYWAPIAKEWPGLFTENIDAAVNWGNGKVYFFKGDQYIRWDIQNGYEYSAPIAKEWPGLFTENIDAAVNWGNGKVYFFKGNRYIRWDIKTDKFEYWAQIAKEWPGLFTDRAACPRPSIGPAMPPRPTVPPLPPPEGGPACDQPELKKRMDACNAEAKRCLVQETEELGIAVAACLATGGVSSPVSAVCNAAAMGKYLLGLKRCRDALLRCHEAAKLATKC